MKYVILKAELADTPRYFGFVFSERWTHADFAEAIERMIALERSGTESNWTRTYKNVKVFSAGFCYQSGDDYVVSEVRSESLKIEKGDAALDAKILNMPEAFNGDVTLYALLPKKNCEHDWQGEANTNGLIDRCRKCGEERA